MAPMGSAFLLSIRPSPSPLPSLSLLQLSTDAGHRTGFPLFTPSRPPRDIGKMRRLTIVAQDSINNVPTRNGTEIHFPVTGGAYDFRGATSLSDELLSSSKRVTLLRHGLSSWNEESRIQGSTNLSVLTEIGAKQAEKCRDSLVNIKFDICFSSPISRAKSTAELIWLGRKQPLVFLDSLKEAHLFFLEGMTNGIFVGILTFHCQCCICVYFLKNDTWTLEAADAKKNFPELYNTWREDPSNFNVYGVYPIQKLWGTAREAWREILSMPGESFLVVTHKSILRALICTALGLSPERFRAIDINNGGISVFTFNKKGEAMLQSLNMTAHMYSSYIYQ